MSMFSSQYLGPFTLIWMEREKKCKVRFREFIWAILRKFNLLPVLAGEAQAAWWEPSTPRSSLRTTASPNKHIPHACTNRLETQRLAPRCIRLLCVTQCLREQRRLCNCCEQLVPFPWLASFNWKDEYSQSSRRDTVRRHGQPSTVLRHVYHPRISLMWPNSFTCNGTARCWATS